MLQTTGEIGHALLIVACVTIGAATVAYGASTIYRRNSYFQYATTLYIVHITALLGAIGLLLTLLITDQFNYHYVWSHSMRELPLSYKIASLWEGQEGSFMLWMFWEGMIGLWILHKMRQRQTAALGFLSFIQFFLNSMLLGVVIYEVKIGSSPFLLLREALSAPVFESIPNFIPENGTGLSPLLQNYWMVIHPPVLFLGFATTSVPFVLILGGLWERTESQSLRLAYPYILIATLCLGIGIVLGAVWAYETLNFGGYWNWDPVENAVYVPWLVLIASLHTTRLYLSKKVTMRLSLALILLSFLLVLYATFLIRSGILGNSSVHSFTDAGLSEQLLSFIGVFSLLSLLLFLRRRQTTETTSYSLYSAEIYMLCGTTVLLFMALQVLIPTSLPVYNTILNSLGGKGNFAPPADPVAFYTNFQLYLASFLLFFSATAQLLWWRKSLQSPRTFLNTILQHLLPALFVTAWVIAFVGVAHISWILLLSAACYASIVFVRLLYKALTKAPARSAGAFAHIGVSCVILGIFFSSGYAKILSVNPTGLIWHEDFPDEVNQNNILLFQSKDREMPGYTLRYIGRKKKLEGVPHYVSTTQLRPLGSPLEVRCVDTLTYEGKTYALPGDTLRIASPDKDYFSVLYRSASNEEELLLPTAQHSPTDESILYAPYILRSLFKDIYVHVRTFSDPTQAKWSQEKEVKVHIGESFFMNDYVARIVDVRKSRRWEQEWKLNKNEAAIEAKIEITTQENRYFLYPVFMIKDQHVGRISDELQDVGARVSLTHISPETEQFTIQFQTTQVSWVILEILEKPLINLLWGGVFLMILGCGIGIFRYIKQ